MDSDRPTGREVYVEAGDDGAPSLAGLRRAADGMEDGAVVGPSHLVILAGEAGRRTVWRR